MDWKTAFDIYTDNQYPLESRLFQDASAVLWNHIQKIANILSSGYHIAVDPDEMTSIFLCRLLKRRNQSFLPISGKSSYISTALRNISIDQYRSELKHATPEADTGRRTKVSLDQSLPEGRQLHELIAAPIQDDDDNIPLFEELEKQLDDRLYDVEIDQVKHRTNKGRQTFIHEASQFRAYRDRQYDPKKSYYKKFDRQREIMKLHLVSHQKMALSSCQYAADQINLYYHNQQIQDLFTLVASQVDSEKQERLLTYRISLIALYEYQRVYGSDETDDSYAALLMNCLHDLFVHQMYRTKRTQKKK